MNVDEAREKFRAARADVERHNAQRAELRERLGALLDEQRRLYAEEHAVYARYQAAINDLWDATHPGAAGGGR